MSGESTTTRARRRRIGLRLRWLLILVILAAAWLGSIANHAHLKARIAQAVKESGGSVYYDDEVAAHRRSVAPVSPARRWLSRLLGEDLFREIREVRIGGSNAPAWSHGAIAAIEDCPALDGLYLNNVDLTDSDLDHIGRLTNLRILHLRGVDCSNATLTQLANLRKLVVLDITDSRIDDVQLASIRNLTRLEKLRLSWLKGPGLSDVGLIHLAGLTKLQDLELADNRRISSAGCNFLANLTALTWLDLDRTQVGDEGVAQFGNLQSLRELRLGKSQITDNGLRSLSPLKTLFVLRIEDAPVTTNGIAWLQASNPGLRFLFSSLH